MKRLTAGLILFFLSVAMNGQEIWTEDWNGALAQARRENKDLLVNFTGSDWCTWCERLSREVFDTAPFKQQAPRDFILVKIDFPRSLPQTPQIKARNRELATRYGVEGYPTILLLDNQGRPYARTGYKQGGPTAYLNELAAFRQNKQRDRALLDQAQRASGLEKARLLDQFYEKMEATDNASFFADLKAEILSLDPQNAAGLRGKYLIKNDYDALQAGLNDNSDWNAALTNLQALELRASQARLVPLQQEIMMTRAAIQLNVLKNNQEGKKILNAVRTLDPNTSWGRQIPGLLQRLGL